MEFQVWKAWVLILAPTRLAVWLWASYLPFLSLSFFIFEMDNAIYLTGLLCCLEIKYPGHPAQCLHAVALFIIIIMYEPVISNKAWPLQGQGCVMFKLISSAI